MTAQDLIEYLQLVPHPEGGFYKETYRADLKVGMSPHGSQDPATRSASTAIYFLLRSQDVSHFHRIDADEGWHFYAGSPLTLHVIHPSGEYERTVLGEAHTPNFQTIVPAGAWFGATVDEENTYALVGCTVAPGFEFSGFEMATRNDLLSLYPQHSDIISRLTQSG